MDSKIPVSIAAIAIAFLLWMVGFVLGWSSNLSLVVALLMGIVAYSVIAKRTQPKVVVGSVLFIVAVLILLLSSLLRGIRETGLFDIVGYAFGALGLVFLVTGFLEKKQGS